MVNNEDPEQTRVDETSDEKIIKDNLKGYLNSKITGVNERIRERIEDLESEDPDYYEILEMFGISEKEASSMDKYHNMGRFIFRNLGSIIEKATLTCLSTKWGGKSNINIENTVSSSPDKFGVDWLHDEKELGYEIKWRYATTDGTTVKKIKKMTTQLSKIGYTPVFLTFYQSNRKQPLRCYKQIADHVKDLGGNVYSKQDGWNHIKEFTGFDLKEFLIEEYTPPKSL